LYFILDHDNLRIGRKQLLRLKTKAMRTGAWFKVLQRIDRALVDLTIKVTDTVQSKKLLKSLLFIKQKLERTMESPLSRAIREVGLPLSQKLSAIAQKLGNASAIRWAFDRNFAAYLAVMHTNNLKT
jgi:hypothetical protein